MKHTIILFSFALATSISLAQIPNLPGSGNCLSFNGTSDWVEVSHNSTLEPTSITIEYWIKSNNVIPWQTVLMKHNNSIATARGFHTGIQGGTPYFWFGNTGPSDLWGNSSINSSVPITSNKWYHIACSFDGTTSAPYTMKMYINGELVNTTTTSYALVYSQQSLQIGRDVYDNGNNTRAYFPGSIDEVRIWNITRTQTEIRNTMCQKLVGNEAGLMGYWRFDETSGTTAYDSSPYGNNGTLK